MKSVQLADFQDAAYVLPGTDIVGSQVGNQLWRSPEVHAQGPVDSPSDMLSFGMVVSFPPHCSQMYTVKILISQAIVVSLHHMKYWVKILISQAIVVSLHHMK